MGLYEEIKDVAKEIKKQGNIEIYAQLIDLSSQALDMQNEIVSLNAEVSELKKSKDIDSKIERHSEPYITLKGDTELILYCSRCWGHEEKLIQVKCYDSGSFKCTNCENTGVYDEAKDEAYSQRRSEMYRNLAARNRRNQW